MLWFLLGRREGRGRKGGRRVMREEGGSTVHFLLGWSCCCTRPFPSSVTLYPPSPLPHSASRHVFAQEQLDSGWIAHAWCLFFGVFAHALVRVCRLGRLAAPADYEPIYSFFRYALFRRLARVPSSSFSLCSLACAGFLKLLTPEFRRCWCPSSWNSCALVLLRTADYLMQMYLRAFGRMCYLPFKIIFISTLLWSGNLCTLQRSLGGPRYLSISFSSMFPTRGAKNLLADQGLVNFYFYVDKGRYQRHTYHHLFSKHVCIIKRFSKHR